MHFMHFRHPLLSPPVDPYEVWWREFLGSVGGFSPKDRKMTQTHDSDTWWLLQCVAVCYSVLRCVAVCCSVLRCVAVCQCYLLVGFAKRKGENWNTLQYSAAHCITLQHTATHGNTRRRTATHCNTMHHTAVLAAASCRKAGRRERKGEREKGERKGGGGSGGEREWLRERVQRSKHKNKNVLCCIISKVNTKQCTTEQYSTKQCNTLQHTATHCNTLQHTAKELSSDFMDSHFMTHTNSHFMTHTNSHLITHTVVSWNNCVRRKIIGLFCKRAL